MKKRKEIKARLRYTQFYRAYEIAKLDECIPCIIITEKAKILKN